MKKTITVNEQEMFEAVLTMLLAKGELSDIHKYDGKIQVTGIRTSCPVFSMQVFVEE